MKKDGENPRFSERSKESSLNRSGEDSPEQNKKTVDLEELPVGEIVKLHKKGLSRKEIREKLSGLSGREVKMAVSHYYCNRRSVENRLKREE